MVWFLLTALVAAAAPIPRVEHQVAGIQFFAPADADVTRHTLTTRADAVAVTRGAEVLVITLYTRNPPSVRRALRTHLEELEKRLIKRAVANTMRTRRARIKFMKRRVVGRTITYRRSVEGRKLEVTATVVARRVQGRTVVATWTARVTEGQPLFSPRLVAGLALTR